MNILNYNLPKAHFHTLIELAKSGHTVYTNYHDSNTYEPSFGINILENDDNVIVAMSSMPVDTDEESQNIKEKMIALTERLIDQYNIDILQVCIPTASYLHEHFADKVKYIGPSVQSSRLETDKSYCKFLAHDIGFNVPRIIRSGKFSDDNYCKDLKFPCIEKPSYIWQPACIMNSQKDADHAIKLFANKQYPKYKDMHYYIEEYLHDMIETNVFFVVSNGNFAITHTQHIIGENLNKTVDGNVWYLGSYIKPLSKEHDQLVRKDASKFLKQITKRGEYWEGSFCGGITPDNKWHFLELNVRPDIFNSTPTFMTGDEYLYGMFEDVSLFEKAWENKNIQKLLITTSDSSNEYPIHLHEKYNVAYPNNLTIGAHGKHFCSNFGITNHDNKVTGAGTVIADHNISLEFIKEMEETTEWKFNAEPNL
jgi:hypothetical protein